MAYASGKYAIAVCDRCGFEYKLSQLKEEWNGAKTCRDCFDPKHPQLEPLPHVSDPEALYKPRPNTDVGVGEGFVVVTYTDIKKGNCMDPNIIGSNFKVDGITGSVGSPSITANEVTITPTAEPTGVSATASLGSVTVSISTTTLYTVTVAEYSGANYFYIDGVRAPTLNLTEGRTYQFGQSDSSNATHPLRISTTSNGTHAGGSEYTTGVTTYGTPGSGGAYTEITVASGAPTLYYYCSNHSGMGGQLNT